MTNINVTGKEFEAYSYQFDVLSDMDYGYNNLTGKFDVPSIEWDGPYGRHWTRYESEEARTLALNAYRTELHNWVINYRKEENKKNIERGRKAKALREAKTLGGQFPVLKELLEKSR